MRESFRNRKKGKMPQREERDRWRERKKKIDTEPGHERE